MYEWCDGRPHFVLIDFDMARVLPADPSNFVPSSKDRPETLTFVAADLLEDAAKSENDDYVPIPHRLHHEYESLNYISYWCATLLVESDDATQRKTFIDTLREWETGSYRRIALIKKGFRRQSDWAAVLPKAAVEAGLDDWFWRWALVFRKVDDVAETRGDQVVQDKKAKRVSPPFDYETMGGLLTRDKLRAALQWIGTTVYDQIRIDTADEDEDYANDGYPVGARDKESNSNPKHPAAADLKDLKMDSV